MCQKQCTPVHAAPLHPLSVCYYTPLKGMAHVHALTNKEQHTSVTPTRNQRAAAPLPLCRCPAGVTPKSQTGSQKKRRCGASAGLVRPPLSLCPFLVVLAAGVSACGSLGWVCEVGSLAAAAAAVVVVSVRKVRGWIAGAGSLLAAVKVSVMEGWAGLVSGR